MPPAKFGALLGVAPGNVPAYSSDYDSSDIEDRSWYRAYHEGVYTGYKYQCVEYARRWLVHVWGVSFGDVRMAFNIFDLQHFVWTTHGDAKVRHLNATMDAKHRSDVAVFEREHQLFLLQEQGTQKKCVSGAPDTAQPSSTSAQAPASGDAHATHAHPHHHGGGGGDSAAHHLQHPSHPHLNSQLHSPVTGPATESSRRASTTLGASSSVLAASSVHSIAPVPASDTDTVSETESTGTVTPWESLCSSTSELDTDAMITGEAVAKKDKCQSSKRVRSEKKKDQVASPAGAPTAVAVPPPAVSAPTLPVKPVPHPTVDGGDVVPILKVRNADPMGHCPEVGSVLLWHEGGFFKHTGHVAIITEVTDTYVRIAEQNVTDRSWKGKAFARELPMTWLGGEAVVPRSQSRDMSIRQMKSGKKHEFFHGAEHPQSGKKCPASSGSDENDVEVIKVGWEIKDAQYRNTKVLGWVTPQIAPEFQLIVEAAKPVVPSPQKA